MTSPIRPGEVGAVSVPDATATADAAGTTGGALPRRSLPRPSWRAASAWVVLTAVGVALDGGTGFAVGVVVVAALLAQVPRGVIGLLGVVSLAAVPIAVLVIGVPKPDDVSPAFVTGNLLPHHLTFAGLSLVGTWVVLDLSGHLRSPARPASDPSAADGSSQPVARLGRAGRFAVVAVVALAGAAAIVGAWAQ